jgi:hypothetical protein
LGNIPTKCTEQSLQRLEALVALPGAGKHITHLALNTCKLYAEVPSTPGLDMEKLSDDVRERTAWIRGTLQEAVAHILRQTIRLGHLTLVCEDTHWTSPAEGQESQGPPGYFVDVDRFAAEEVAAGIPDPLKVSVLSEVTQSRLI